MENGKLPKKNLLSMQIDLSKFTPATDDEKRQIDVMRESTTFFRDGMRKLFKNPLSVASLIALLLIVVAIFAAPVVCPYGYDDMIEINGVRDRTAKNLAPLTYSENEQAFIAEGGKVFPHIFGTDQLCRDYFIRVVYATRVSLAVGLFASIIVLIIGLSYGAISGYFGGKVDLIMMRIVDIIYSLPDMLMIILLAVVLDPILGSALSGTVLASLGTNMISIFVVFGLLYWVSEARLIRGQILSIKENDYIMAAKAMGAKTEAAGTLSFASPQAGGFELWPSATYAWKNADFLPAGFTPAMDGEASVQKGAVSFGLRLADSLAAEWQGGFSLYPESTGERNDYLYRLDASGLTLARALPAAPGLPLSETDRRLGTATLDFARK